MVMGESILVVMMIMMMMVVSGESVSFHNPERVVVSGVGGVVV